MHNYCATSNCDSDPSSQSEVLVNLPPTPISLENLDSCFSDAESHCESGDLLDETASELEAVKSDPHLERVDSFVTAKPNVHVLGKPTRSYSTQIRSPRLPNRTIDAVKSSIFTLDPSLSRSDEQLGKKSKSTSTALDKLRQRFSSDALLDGNRPPLPPRTYHPYPGQENQKIISKPLPPIPTDEEEYIPNYRRKLSSSMDCLIDKTVEEEPSPYIAPIDLHPHLKREDQSLASSSHISERPPLPAIPTEPPSKPNITIARSHTQYLPGRKYGHKRSRSSNCDFLKSLPKDDKPLNSHKDTRNSLNPYATLRPSSFARSMRARSGSPSEPDLESSLQKKNSFKFKSSKQSLIPDETDQNSFETYTRMSPASSLDVRVSVCLPQEPLRDQHKPSSGNGSDTDITEGASAVPPRRGERRKARRWETNKDAKNKSEYNSANRLYWEQRQQAFEGPRYVSQPSIQNDSQNLSIRRHNTDSITNSKRSSRDSNIYEHVDEDVLEGLRRSHIDDFRSTPRPGVFPHPPTAQEWHYFMYMWQLFLQWMSEHAPPEVYSVPNNIPTNVNNTSPLLEHQIFTETIDEDRKESVTSYTSIDCEWIKNIAKTSRTSTLVEDGARASGTCSSRGYSDSTEANTVVNKHPSLRSQNSCATLSGNGKSVSSVDSGICHSQNDDFNSNGDS